MGFRRRVLGVSAAMLVGALALLPVEPVGPHAHLKVAGLAWWLMIVPCALGGMEVRFRTPKSVVFATFLEFPLVIGLFVTSGRGLVAAFTLGNAVALAALRYRPLLFVYNTCGNALESCLALVVFHLALNHGAALGVSGLSASLLAMTVCAIVGSARQVVVAMSRGERFECRWLNDLLVSIVISLANTTLAIVVLELLHANALFAWPIGVVGAIVLIGYRGYISLLNHHEGLNRLYETTRSFEAVTTGDGSARTMLDRSVELLGAEFAELALVVPNGARLQWFRSEHGRAAYEIASSRGGSRAVEELITTRSDVDRYRTVKAGDKRELVARLQGAHGPIGLLRVAMFTGAEFSESDRRLFEMFVTHASTALQNSQLVDQLRGEAAQRRHEALHDALTGLPNRVMFDLQARRALTAAGREAHVAVALVDLDHFKEVNDTLGHHLGDELLVELGRRLQVLADERGLVVSRLGGDEFAVLMTSTSGDSEIAATAELVRAAIEAPVDIASVRVDVGVSMGVAVFDPSCDEPDDSTLLRRADVAMYVAKDQHRGIVFYDRADDPYSAKRLSLAADLRGAVERGEIQAHFQPEVDLRTGDVVAVEALARWTHPVHGNIVPDQFIPIAEQSGLIRDLTYLMLEQSLHRVRQWRRQGFQLSVAVNLSVRCLSDDRLVERVCRQLELAGLPPDCLTLEVTEGTIMADPAQALDVLGRLHREGIRLSVDDFGMGYSSLAQLKSMPVGQLKIDRSFVTNLTDDPDDEAIVKSVTELGHNLQLEVIAEGCEDRATYDKLAELGCDSVQGYFLARPMSADQMSRWLRERDQDRHDWTGAPLAQV